MPPVDHDRLPVSLIERFSGGGGRGDASDLVGLPFVEPTSYKPVRNLVAANAAVRYGARPQAEGARHLSGPAGHLPGSRLRARAAAGPVLRRGTRTRRRLHQLLRGGVVRRAIPDLTAVPPAQLARLSAIFRGLEGRVTGSALAAADEAVMDIYGLRSHDRRVVEDALARARPILLNSREERQAEVARVAPDLLHDYGCEVAHWLDTALRETSSARTVVTRGIRVAPDVVALRLDVEDGPVRPLERFRIADPDLFEIGLFGDTANLSSMKFSRGRSMRVYLNKSIYIVKPDERRHWTLSNAQSDLRRVVDDLTSGRVRAPVISIQARRPQYATSVIMH